MAENTKIEWAHHTFNPWIGCTKVSPACDHCYAEADFDKRRKVVQWGAGQPRKLTAPSTWAMPDKWNAEAERLGVRYRVFCASLADVFDNEVPAQWRTGLLELIHQTPHLDWLLLTKRIGNAHHMLNTAASNQTGGPPTWWSAKDWPNVWIGASITSQAEADRDIPKLLAVPAAKRFLSMEPLLGPVDLEQACDIAERSICAGTWDTMADPQRCVTALRHGSVRLLDWVIVGGESGPNARPMHPDWARDLRDQCQAAGVPFLFKQWGEFRPALHEETPSDWVDRFAGKNPMPGCIVIDQIGMLRAGKKAAGRMLDGRTWDEAPA